MAWKSFARRFPQANGVAERFVRTVRSECLDWLLKMNQQHLEQVLAVFVDHYNGHRPHRALDLTAPSRCVRDTCERPTRAELVSSVVIASVDCSVSSGTAETDESEDRAAHQRPLGLRNVTTQNRNPPYLWRALSRRRHAAHRAEAAALDALPRWFSSGRGGAGCEAFAEAFARDAGI
jgi:hypothetical protein